MPYFYVQLNASNVVTAIIRTPEPMTPSLTLIERPAETQLEPSKLRNTFVHATSVFTAPV